MSIPRAAVDPIINAVLYEGYILYPYRASSCKNRQRWTFGALHPCGVGSSPSRMQAQCLIEGTPDSLLQIEAGFLQPVEREVAVREASGQLRNVAALQLGERRYSAWQEAIERRIALPAARLRDLSAAPYAMPFALCASQAREELYDARGNAAGVITRTQAAIAGRVTVAAEAADTRAYRLTLVIENLTPPPGEAAADPGTGALRALGSTHAVLAVSNGAFVSLMDPPPALAQAAAACRNSGCYPVLAGDPGDRGLMLVSPIILYDYPRIAPESPGDFFDGTEIDEMLSLRILTLTDDEKLEMAGVDERARRLLARTEALGARALAGLHGAWRASITDDFLRSESAAAPGPRLAALQIGDRAVKLHDRVRLRPRARADIMDLTLAGRIATIESIERDFDDRVHIAVIVDDDPGRDFGLQRMPGHRFFFAPEELEPL